MTRQDIRIRVAENVGILADDGITIVEKLVTIAGLNRRIDDIYREELFLPLSNLYPDDFIQKTYQQPTYTASGTVSASTTGTTLIATTAIFDNTMEGFQVQNATDGTFATIVTYTSPTQVTIDTNIGDTWDGDSIYVLGNEFTFGGDATDLKEVLQVTIKYKGSDTYYRVVEPRVYKDIVRQGSEVFSTNGPSWYQTDIQSGGISKPAIGFEPFPTDYTGSWKMIYIQRPGTMNESDKPLMENAGISQAIIYGVTAWAFRVQRKWDDAQYYKALYDEQLGKMIKSYKPRNRNGATKVRQSNRVVAATRHYV